MLIYDFEDSICCWFALTTHALRRAMAARLAQEGITLRQWEVLAWCVLEGELSQAELAERLGIEAPTLVGILDRMERDGWLTRNVCSEDRRRKRIRVTEQAENVWSRMVTCARDMRSYASRGISSEDLATLKRLCRQIRDNLEGVTGTEDIEALCCTPLSDDAWEIAPPLADRAPAPGEIEGHAGQPVRPTRVSVAAQARLPGES